jgi:hypothetical protein
VVRCDMICYDIAIWGACYMQWKRGLWVEMDGPDSGILISDIDID